MSILNTCFRNTWCMSRRMCTDVSTYLCIALVGRPDFIWTVDRLARAVTKWHGASDKRLARRIRYIHFTVSHRHFCHVGNSASQCQCGLFHDTGLEGDLVDSKPISGGILCVCGDQTFVPISWTCRNKQRYLAAAQELKFFFFDAGLHTVESCYRCCGNSLHSRPGRVLGAGKRS